MGFRLGSEENQRQRVMSPQMPSYLGRRPSWAEDQAVLESMRNRPQDDRSQQMAAIAQGFRQQGEDVRTGFGDIGQRFVEGQERISRAEDRELQRQQTQQQMEAAQAAERRAQSQEMRSQAGFEQETARRNLDLEAQQRANAASLRREQQLGQQALEAGFPDAREGETVEQYVNRLEVSQRADEARQIRNQIDRELAEFDEWKATAGVRRDLDAENIRQMRLANKMNAYRGQREIREGNIQQMAGELSRAIAQDPNAANAIMASWEAAGIPKGEIGEAFSQALSRNQASEYTKVLINQARPEYKYQIEAMDKAKRYTQILGQLNLLAQNLSNLSFWDSAEEKQATANVVSALDAIGQSELARSVESIISKGEGGPQGRRTAAENAIKMIQKQFAMDLHNTSQFGLGAYANTRPVQEAYGAYQDLGWRISNQMGSQQPGPDIFGNAGGIDIRNLGTGGAGL